MLLTVITAVCVLSMTQSAFAQTVSPRIQGMYDTWQDAKPLSNSEIVGLALTSANDVDWLKWTNDTGVTKYVFASLLMIEPDNFTNYNLDFTIDYPDGNSTGPMPTPDSGPGSTNPDSLSWFQIPPNATVYLKVYAKEGAFSAKTYKLYWGTQDI
ncbi:hypothetical protein [Paenibacillus aquistagni]|uniref:Uncharacterized protein n=1 Tax=Paenibacillus aquistagni TaxID=1852522 RepID=A0A1X7LSG5_9BACL|nr:hypothetical protein [Paenibacillus aquistagni]SMG56427.1 hypothetical protein SAMN06295960_4125 [Paenibacillus aquistagni]